MRSRTLGLAALAAAVFGASASASPFVAGDLAVFQAATASNNTTGTILEVKPTGANQTAVQSIPIDGVTTPNELRFSGSASTTGFLSHTDDRSLLTFAGANSATASGNSNALTARGVGVLDASGAFSMPTTYTESTSGNQPRSATSLDDSTWYIGDQTGIFTNGSTAASPAGNVRSTKAFGGGVYVSEGTGIFSINAPTGGTLTALPGVTGVTGISDFYMAKSGSSGSAYDELYMITSTSILKYSLVSGTWSSNGSYTGLGGFGVAATADASGGTDLYATTGSGSTDANLLVALHDTAGYNAAISIATGDNVTLFTTPAGTNIKGVDFVPVPEPTSLAFLATAIPALLARRRARR